jgi:hypothetical protein
MQVLVHGADVCCVLCAGEPMRYAKAALLTGLLKLDLGDRFGVVAFDHDQQWWSGEERPSSCSAASISCSPPTNNFVAVFR